VDGETGLLAEGPERFTAQLERMLTDGALRQRLGEAARRRCASFTWERAAGEFAAVLDAAVVEAATRNGQRAP